MRLVLLSGGSGTRLWPLSNATRSKQFLNVLQDPDGNLESMVQRVWRQLGEIGLSRTAHIASSKDQEDILRQQLGPQVPLILEPSRRDTFPAVALAAAYLYSNGIGLDETVAVLPVDPHVDSSFFHTVRRLESVLEETEADIALIGVEPGYPTEKYGYIVPADSSAATEGDNCWCVGHFREKPPAHEAAALIRDGAVWNSGVFAFRLGFMIELLMEKGLPLQYDHLLRQYDKLTKTSFDYEVVERAERIAALTYKGTWKDLGTWSTLTEEIENNVIGNGYVSPDSHNSHLINELDIPIALIGIEGAIVAAGADGIIVAEKSSSHRIKEVSEGFSSYPRLEVRSWGVRRIVDRLGSGVQATVTSRISLAAAHNFSYHYHEIGMEVWTVISGEGEAVIDGELLAARPGDVFVIPSGKPHSMRGISDMELICVQRGEKPDSDELRICTSWSDISTFYIKSAV
ncbi:sugar phosphate nucleotidyltransferase [Cohnella panacarvi]|uniref:sugar phosphate nucleotidyltransferase n=1 Tax=Cohnella panacarvi TaxID=400776 RepID=UPI00054D686D|nr:sugar phosphate nucleotidyltransferase [Cohnella panacarvi]